MQKRFLFAFLFLLTALVTVAQLRAPENFLGYKVGTRFTPHWKIVNYFNHAAAAVSSTMKLQQYGETHEGRPLILAFISSAENISNLENIRKNNLRLANLSPDKPDSYRVAADENAPAIIWMSYNVHGNEPASSEAAMLALYGLTDPSNTKTKEWLKNTVVIIDPCINPDGRDRYVNWYNAVVGKNFNPRQEAREHQEPWPRGRSNHYNFDLNRDWAWQTQVESRQRVKTYLQWMPQVHVDFHEQGYNEPYYFAPAAEPFHEVITTWQREFQTTIGKNNAKYFDQNSWLFFTRQRFDLLYPSYGDTWPTYNGSIGMTYEQGGISAGLGVINEDDDTLTLVDRTLHHFTTSLSTVEISSANASKLVTEFRKYFNNAVTNGAGDYKSYIIKYDPKRQQLIAKLTDLLDKNGIQYSQAAAGTVKGVNYSTGKEESLTINSQDILISTYQPRSAMVKVLFEQRSKLVDSLTYDITAWSLPYAYGLNAYAIKEKISTGVNVPATLVNNPVTEYGYIMPWNGVSTVKATGRLLQKGILVRYAEQPFEINGNKFDRGAILILKTSNKEFGRNLWSIVKEVADAEKIQLYPASGGFVDKGSDFGSDMVHALKAPRVALVTGEGISSGAAGEVWSFFEQEIDYPLTLINANDLARADWNSIDVLIMPDGNYRMLTNKEDLESFKAWISRGGRVVALEGAVVQLAKAEVGIKQKKTEEEAKKDKADNYAALKTYEERERDFVSGTTPGAILKVELDNTHPLAFGYPGHYYTLKLDDNIYEFLKDGGWNVGVIKKENQVAGFIGAGLLPKLRDGLLFGVQQVGKGTVSYLADDVLFRNFWENGKLMFCNAVFLVGQ